MNRADINSVSVGLMVWLMGWVDFVLDVSASYIWLTYFAEIVGWRNRNYSCEYNVRINPEIKLIAWLMFHHFAKLPSRVNYIFPSAQAALGRQWNDQNQSQPNPDVRPPAPPCITNHVHSEPPGHFVRLHLCFLRSSCCYFFLARPGCTATVHGMGPPWKCLIKPWMTHSVTQFLNL